MSDGNAMDKDAAAAAAGKAAAADKAEGDKDHDKYAGGAAFAHPGKSPKKRRKVNHDMDRGLTLAAACSSQLQPAYIAGDLCIKRNIGHLCHDEPREGDTKKLKNGKPAGATADDDTDAQSQAPSDVARSSISSTMGPPPSFDGTRQRSASGFTAAGVMGQENPMSLVQPTGATGATGLQGNGSNNGSSGNANQ
ncbi:Regulator of drug sensitivity 2, partial [Tolypocladium capitatum]